jgi:hypothetical protein
VRILTTPGVWRITLNDGTVLRVWADGFQEIDGNYDFGLLIEADGDLPDTADITNRTPSDPKRVVVSVARLPMQAVRDIDGG